ncbi:MAG: SsrA-binding protein SmpB [Candidatus Pacebacteria bacterium]|nr:SsrA-binding protein SmpB [Candidatus Paceibacterota bacterium]
MNLLVNKKLHHSYEVLDTFEAGLQLNGSEVKTLRAKHGSLKEAYITTNNGEVFLTSCHLPHFQPGHKRYENVDTYRQRKLLLHKKQIEKLREKTKQRGLTIVPVRIYAKKNLIKIEIAIARGKQQHDKRIDMKNRTSKREAERAIKNLY